MPGATATQRSAFDARRRSARHLTAATCGIVTLTYVWMFIAVRAVEADASENTFGAYLQLSLIYLIGTGLAIWLDNRVVWAIGAVVQLTVITLFLIFGMAIFDYALAADLPLELWALTTLVAQVLLFGLLTWLAATPRRTPTADPGA
jgi:hypothetical protein